MTYRLKILLCLNEKLFDFKNTSFRYYGFSVAMYFCETVDKDVCITEMCIGRNYHTL